MARKYRTHYCPHMCCADWQFGHKTDGVSRGVSSTTSAKKINHNQPRPSCRYISYSSLLLCSGRACVCQDHMCAIMDAIQVDCAHRLYVYGVMLYLV